MAPANGVLLKRFLLPCMVNRQLPYLIKQADVAVLSAVAKVDQSYGDGDTCLRHSHNH